MKTAFRSIMCILLAFFAFGPWDIQAQQNAQDFGLVLTGSSQDQSIFLDLCAKCGKRSDTFKNVFTQALIQNLPLAVGRDFLGPGGLFGAFGAGAVPHKIDLAHIDSLPVLAKNANGKWVQPANVPDWAPTQCTILGHELAEALHAFMTGQDYPESHQQAIRTENRIRDDLGIKGCREWDAYPNFEAKITHGRHTDSFVYYGGHLQRIHRYDTPFKLNIDYETGDFQACTKKHRDDP